MSWDASEYKDGYDDEQAVEVYFQPPEGHIVDEDGRLMKSVEDLIDPEYLPEHDIQLFVSKWLPIQPGAHADWEWTSRVVWPDENSIVTLRRLDLFEQDSPKLQIGTFDAEDSYQVRCTPGWYPVRSVFFSNRRSSLSIDLMIESTGPPRRSKFRPQEKQNQRDLSTWLPMDTVYAFHGPLGMPGSCQFYVDYADLPDRYFISSDALPALGNRRIFRFGAYSATQYFVMEKLIQHESLDAEGGTGLSYTIEKGPILYARKGWRLIGSFFGFDHQLPGSSEFTVYRRSDPFPRMLIAMQPIQNPQEWNSELKFFAFDVPVPGTAKYSIHHCLRSIYSNKASIQRHRMTTDDARLPWELRMQIYVFPAELHECTIYPYPTYDPYGGLSY